MGGYTASNFLKWYWWRFNGQGYFWGMMTGMFTAGVAPWLMPSVTPIYTFPLIFAVSLAASIAATLLTPPDDMAVLKTFYRKVRPWGFWKPVHDACVAETPDIQQNKAFGRDMFNVAVGIAWQTGLTAAPIFLVIQDFPKMWLALGVVAVCSVVLKFYWLDRLRDEAG